MWNHFWATLFQLQKQNEIAQTTIKPRSWDHCFCRIRRFQPSDREAIFELLPRENNKNTAKSREIRALFSETLIFATKITKNWTRLLSNRTPVVASGGTTKREPWAEAHSGNNKQQFNTNKANNKYNFEVIWTQRGPRRGPLWVQITLKNVPAGEDY